ncbi:hypothetical protein JCM8097_002087 [Rhodosporidiobolus ruineniae]
MTSLPPSRPPPPPPTEAPPPPSAFADTHSVDDAIDLSTRSYLASSFRSLFLPWTFRLVVFTSCAKLARFFLPYLLLAVRWSVSRLWHLLELLLRATTFLALYAGLVATAVWLLLGVAAGAAYLVLYGKPAWRAYAHRHPARATVVRKVVVYSGGFFLLRLVLGRRIAKTALVGVLGAEAVLYIRRQMDEQQQRERQAGRAAVAVEASSAAPLGAESRPPGGFAPSPPPDEADDEELERWARQVKEEMLRDSLLRAGRRRERTEEEGEGDQAAEEEVDAGTQAWREGEEEEVGREKDE